MINFNTIFSYYSPLLLPLFPGGVIFQDIVEPQQHHLTDNTYL